MSRWETAVMAMISVSAMGVLIAEGELTRVRYVRAMRNCLMRISEMIRYEQPDLKSLLLRIDLRGNVQEKQLTAMLHETAKRLDRTCAPQLIRLFRGQSVSRQAYGILSEEDRRVFETLLGNLGRLGLEEQIKSLEAADVGLAKREAELDEECARRAKLIRALSISGGAAAFLLIV